MKYALSNCTIYTGDSVLTDGAVIVDGRTVSAVVPSAALPGGLEAIDLKGANLAPGFIDTQVNGGGGALFTDDPSVDCLRTISRTHRRFGTTSFLPTLMTAWTDRMLQAIDSARTVMQEPDLGVLGIHLEGPYISEGRAGVHDVSYIRRPSQEELSAVMGSGKGAIRLWTVAPEMVEEAGVRRMRDNGVPVSAGHTDATYEQAKRFFEWGGSAVTHLFNAMSQLGSREPGMVGACFDSPETWAGIIVDGIHVDFASVRIASKLKGAKLLLATDAMPPVGCDLASFRLGDRQVGVAEGRCTTIDGRLAGSTLDMAGAVRNSVHKVGIPMDEALRMASTYPAEFLGVGDRLGRIAPGYQADMVVFDDRLVLKAVVKNGVYQPIPQ